MKRVVLPVVLLCLVASAAFAAGGTEADLRKALVGSWETRQTASGEILVFAADGTYSGYDGRSEFKGTWKLKGTTLTLQLSTGGSPWDQEVRFRDGDLYLDDTRYTRTK